MGPRNGRNTLRARNIERMFAPRTLNRGTGGWRREWATPKTTARLVTSPMQRSRDLPTPLALLSLLALLSPPFAPSLPSSPPWQPSARAHPARYSATVPARSPTLWCGIGAGEQGVVAGDTNASAVGRTGPAPGGAAISVAGGSVKDVDRNAAGSQVPGPAAAASCGSSCSTSRLTRAY